MGVTSPKQQSSTTVNTKKSKSNVNAYSTHSLNQMRKHESKIIKEMTRPSSTIKAERREKSPMDKSADRKSKKQLSKNDKLSQSKSTSKRRNFETRKVTASGQRKEDFSRYL